MVVWPSHLGWWIIIWAVLSDEQMSNGYPFSLVNDEQMSNKVGVKHQPVMPFAQMAWRFLVFNEWSDLSTSNIGPKNQVAIGLTYVLEQCYHHPHSFCWLIAPYQVTKMCYEIYRLPPKTYQTPSLRIQVCPKKGISPTILFWDGFRPSIVLDRDWSGFLLRGSGYLVSG